MTGEMNAYVEEDAIYENVSEAIETESLKMNLTDINVSVNCNIATLKLSLDELQKLKVGDVLNINSSYPLVSLTLNGICFAQGYLVEIQGMLGIKINKRNVLGDE